MSLVSQSMGPVPSETERIAKASFPKGAPLVILRDELGPLFQDEEFSDLYSWKGAEGISPTHLATVTVLQYVEGLSDRQAAHMMRGRIDWKYLLGVPLDYAGFDYSVLSEFRSRLLSADATERLFEIPLAKMKTYGLVRSRGRQRSDSTHVLAAVATLNRIELVGETLRYTLNQIAIVAPQWLSSWTPEAWFERYHVRIEEAKLPTSKHAREELVQNIGQDGFRLLDAIAQADAPEYIHSLPVIEILQRVWREQFIRIQDDDSDSNWRVEWRPAEEMSPSEEMINSPYDPDAHFSRKGKTTWVGYKAHLTESCDDDLPHIITHVETTPANQPDDQTLGTIHDALAEKGLLPAEHLIDSGYVDVENVLDSQQLGVEVVGPMRPNTSWQAKAQTGYDIAHFIIDWEAQEVTCPQRNVSCLFSPSTDKHGVETFTARFPHHDCAACPARELCTRAKSGPRGIRFQPREKHETLQQARREQQESSFRERYKKRAGVEGTISQSTRSFGMRRTRYIGDAKTRLQHLAIASAVNISRLAGWFMNIPHSITRVSAFAELAPFPVC